LRRSIILLIVSLSLFIGLFAIFINLTEVDIILRESLRIFVPQEWQDALRPLRAPMVLGFSPDWESTDVSLRSPVSITFLTPMNASLTESSVYMEPAVRGEFSWRGNTLIFTPTEDWPLQTRVTVAVSREARSWLLRRMESEFSSHFTTLGPPAVVETEPAQDARYTYLRDRLTITFNRPMDHESVERRLHISPEVSRQRLAWRDEQLIISGVLRPSTEYRIVIQRGARDTLHHMETLEDFEWSFTTTERYPYLAITGVGREALVRADTPAELELSLVNVTRVDLDLYAIDVSTYISMTNFSYDDWRSFKPAQEPLRSWSIDPEVTLDRDKKSPLEMEALQPGLYFLTARSPERAQDSQILVSTRTGLTLKRTARQALVWATSLEDGRPMAELPLTIYNAKGEIVATGMSDEDGIFSTEIPEAENGLHVLAQKDDDLSLCSDGWQDGIEPWRFEKVLWQWEAGPRKHKLFLYTDRPLYRPGQKVYLRGVLRMDNDGDYSLTPVGTPVQVTVANYQNNVLYEQTLETNAFGTIHGDFVLNDEVGLGEYFVKAQVEGEEHLTIFRVEEYRKPEYAVDITTDHDSYVNGDVISATISANYYFGAPVTGATVQYTLYSNDYYFFWGDEDIGIDEFASPRYWGYGRELAGGEGITDEKGDFEVALRADITREEMSQMFTLEATVTDPSNQPVSETYTFLVHRGDFYIALRPERYVILSGQRGAVNVQTVDTEGAPIGDVELSYTLYLVEWQKVRRTVEGVGYWDWQEVVSEMETSDIRTDSDGRGRISFVPRQGGLYQLQAQGRDGRGNRVLSTIYLWVSEEDRSVAWRFEEHDRIELVTDKRSYTLGDTAKILIQSPYDQATALVTVERGRIIDYHLIEMEGNSTAVEIPVKREYFPNVFVSVVLAPRDGVGDEPPSFKIGYAELRVESAEKELRISIVPDREEYQPRQMATYTIRTRDHLDRAVSAEVSLGVIDASIYALAGDMVQDIVDAFYGRRQLAVRTAHSLTIHVDRIRLTEDFGGGGGIGEQELRHIFPDVAYWNPAVVTDENGMARVEFPMPDNLTTWRTFAKGVTVDTLVGAADMDVITTKDLILRPLLPRFLSVGDEAMIGAVIHNYTGRTLETQVSLTATNLLLPPELSYTVVISDGQAAEVSWPVEAAQALSTTLTMIADSPTVRDVVQLTLPVLPFGEKRVLVDVLTVEEEEAHQVMSLPSDARFPSLEIDLSPSLAAGLIDSLEYLTGYPYGCVEQTMSRFLPDVLVSQVLDRLGLENESLRAELPEQVEDGLQRLYRFQHYDGGWGWWEGSESEPYQTAYVVYGLTQARKAGYEVNEEVLQRGVEFLRQSLLQTHDLDLRAYISYVLAECGEGDLSLARSLSERRNRMGLYAQAYLALTLDTLGGSREAKVIVDELTDGVTETVHTARWEEESHDRATMSSDGRTTALILQALLATDPEHALIPKTVRWLMWTRSGGYWRTTQETAATIIALSEYLALSGELEAHFSYQVFLNGELVAEDVLTPENIAEHLELKIVDLAPGDNEIRVVKEGEGQLYLATTLQYYGEKESLETARSLGGPLVQRRYEHPESGELLTSYGVGDLIRVRLTVELPEDMWYVIVEDPLPSGTEAVNGTLNTTAIGEGGGRYYWSHPDLRDEKAVFFTTYLWEGAHEYTYLIRATTAGSFRAMPTEVMPMYEPEVWGRSTSGVLDIDR
jgi:uncharacterized protein YfaS (alpha-2-macroglobulin family)